MLSRRAGRHATLHTVSRASAPRLRHRQSPRQSRPPCLAGSQHYITHSTHPLAVGSRLEEDDGRLAVPALHREVERCVSRTVGSVEARLRTALGRVEEDVQKRSVASCCGTVQWMLIGTVPCIDLHMSATAPSAAACENTHIGSTRNEKPSHLLVSNFSSTQLHGYTQAHSLSMQHSAAQFGPSRLQRRPGRRRRAAP